MMLAQQQLYPASRTHRRYSRPINCQIRAQMADAAADGKKPFVLGLTGSVGMGKTTVAQMFIRHSVPVMDSDAVVHDMYKPGGAAVPVVQQLFPSAIVDGGVDRKELGRCVLNNKPALASLEAAVHPLVAAARHQFLGDAAAQGQQLVVLDIPLLYEKSLESEVDAVAVVSAKPEDQQARVLARGWTQEKLDAILALQVPDAVKRSKANFIIDTSQSLQDTEQAVLAVIQQISSQRASDDWYADDRLSEEHKSKLSRHMQHWLPGELKQTAGQASDAQT